MKHRSVRETRGTTAVADLLRKDWLGLLGSGEIAARETKDFICGKKSAARSGPSMEAVRLDDERSEFDF